MTSKIVTTKGGPPAKPGASRLDELVGGRRGELVKIPGIQGTWRIELLGTLASNTVESELIKSMTAQGIDLTVVTAERWELERACRTLARVVLDPANGQPIATFEEWGAQDPDVINAAWLAYGDVRERLDPLAQPLTEHERLAIETAAKKGDGQLLRSYGVVKLSACMRSMAEQLWTSPPPSSSSSESQTVS